MSWLTVIKSDNPDTNALKWKPTSVLAINISKIYFQILASVRAVKRAIKTILPNVLKILPKMWKCVGQCFQKKTICNCYQKSKKSCGEWYGTSPSNGRYNTRWADGLPGNNCLKRADTGDWWYLVISRHVGMFNVALSPTEEGWHRWLVMGL